MRCAINVFPLKESVCAECVVAFWANITVKAKGQRPGQGKI
jgi:hypothetical protein